LRRGSDFRAWMIPESQARRVSLHWVESLTLFLGGIDMPSTLTRWCASLVLSLALAGSAAAQLSAGNAAGVAMGHLHFVARDVAATKAWWVKLGGEPVTLPNSIEGAKFPDVLVLL